MNDIEELLEFERCTPRQHRDQFFSDQVRNSTGKCIFLEDSHRLTTITQIRPNAALFSHRRRGKSVEPEWPTFGPISDCRPATFESGWIRRPISDLRLRLS